MFTDQKMFYFDELSPTRLGSSTGTGLVKIVAIINL